MSNSSARWSEYIARVIANISRQAEDGPVVLSKTACYQDSFLGDAITEIKHDCVGQYGLKISETGDEIIITKIEVSK